ncbi:unknown [Clostridium sp. CAG:242]|nr:unknown [Clostridium sp. CAG:242]
MVIPNSCGKCFNKKKIQVLCTWIFFFIKVNDHAEEYLNDLFPL